MVLYVFSRCLRGEGATPLTLLRAFLHTFARFDWDRYALSLLGPVRLDSFPNPRGARRAARA